MKSLWHRHLLSFVVIAAALIGQLSSPWLCLTVGWIALAFFSDLSEIIFTRIHGDPVENQLLTVNCDDGCDDVNDSILPADVDSSLSLSVTNSDEELTSFCIVDRLDLMTSLPTDFATRTATSTSG